MADRKDFVTTFEYFTKEPFPLELPPNYEVFQTIQREVELDVLVGLSLFIYFFVFVFSFIV